MCRIRRHIRISVGKVFSSYRAKRLSLFSKDPVQGSLEKNTKGTYICIKILNNFFVTIPKIFFQLPLLYRILLIDVVFTT
jgi:hypothetical protein